MFQNTTVIVVDDIDPTTSDVSILNPKTMSRIQIPRSYIRRIGDPTDEIYFMSEPLQPHEAKDFIWSAIHKTVNIFSLFASDQILYMHYTMLDYTVYTTHDNLNPMQ